MRDLNCRPSHQGSCVVWIEEVLDRRKAYGGDGAPCNNTLDAFHEMRLAATLHLPQFGPRAMPAAEVLAMATIRGARALGLADEIGSIEPGKKADLAVVDLSGAHCQPAGPDPHATLVYCARASDVTDVLIEGKPVVRARKLLTLDAEKLASSAPKEAARILRRLSGAARTQSGEGSGRRLPLPSRSGR